MGEDYLERCQRHLNEDHKFQREQSKRDIGILKAQSRIDALNKEIARRERSEELKTLLDEMQQEKTRVLKGISSSSSVHKDKWIAWLNRIDLTEPTANGELQNLVEEIEREKMVWSKISLNLPEWWTRHVAPSPGSDEKNRPSRHLGPVELRLEQERHDRELQRSLKESELGLIVSSLGLLITTQKMYKAALSR